MDRRNDWDKDGRLTAMWFKIYAQESYKSKKMELVAIVKSEELLKHVKSYYEGQYVDVKVESSDENHA